MGVIRLLLIAWLTVRVGTEFASAEFNITEMEVEDAGDDENSTKQPGGPRPMPKGLPMSVYGVLGTNYFTDNGRPYINCIKRLGDEKEETSTKCFLDLGRINERLGCMTIFRYNGTHEQWKKDKNPGANLVITAQDCWQYAADVADSCSMSNKCTYKENISSSGMYFCCCNEHNCNDGVHFAPEVVKTKIFAISSTSTPEAHQPSYIKYVLLATALLFFAVLLLVFFTIRNYRKLGKGSVEDSSMLLEQTLTMQKPEPRLDVTDMVELDKGHFAKVYRGLLKCRDGTTRLCAVKEFRDNYESFIVEKGILQELCARPIQNENIVKWYGWDFRGNNIHWIATKYEPLGNLKDYLIKTSLTVQQSLRIMTSFLDGLAYLHEEKVHDGNFLATICHRDIKGSNVLLRYDQNEQLVACICDFGLALKCDPVTIRQLSGQAQVGTKRYMAPEVLEGATEFTQSAFRQIDIYATALLLWEITERTQTFPGEQVPDFKQAYELELGPIITSINYIRAAVCQRKLRPVFRQAVMEHSSLSLVANTAQEMWYEESDARISAACALQRLRQLSGEDSEGYHSAVSAPRGEDSSEEAGCHEYFSHLEHKRPLVICGNEIEMQVVT